MIIFSFSCRAAVQSKQCVHDEICAVFNVLEMALKYDFCPVPIILFRFVSLLIRAHLLCICQNVAVFKCHYHDLHFDGHFYFVVVFDVEMQHF